MPQRTFSFGLVAIILSIQTDRRSFSINPNGLAVDHDIGIIQ